MKRFHLFFGLALLVAFVLTGQYMDKVHNHLEGMEMGMRMLYRTRHIFLLLASLTHLGLGFYLQPRTGAWQRRTQLAGTIALAIGALLLLAAFFLDSARRDLSTPYSHWGIEALLLGLALHGLSALRERASAGR